MDLNAPFLQKSPQTVPTTKNHARAWILAIGMHILLVLLLIVGVNWQSKTPDVVQAELWSALPQTAAPEPDVSATQTKSAEIPKIDPVAPSVALDEAKLEKPKPIVKTPSTIDPDIALEAEKKRKHALEKQAKQELAERKQHNQEKISELAQKRAEEKAKRETALKQEQEHKEQEKKRLAEQKKQAEREALEEEKKETALREKQLQAELKRITGQASGANNNAGTSTQNAGPRGDPGYGSKLKAKIKSNLIYTLPPDLSGHPEAIVLVNLLPDGSLASAPQFKKRSGLPAYDAAIERAITKSEPFPRDRDGQVPASIEIRFAPKE